MARKYRVAVVHYQPPQKSGGGYTFHQTIINALKKTNHENFEFRFYNTVEVLERRFGRSFLKKIIGAFSAIAGKMGVEQADHRLVRSVRNILRAEEGWKPHVVDSAITSDKCDFAYFPTPLPIKLSIPFILTHWDLAHRRWPIFPEVSFSCDPWEKREEYHRAFILRAAKVITGTETGKNELVHAYGARPELIQVNPFPVPEWVDTLEPTPPRGFQAKDSGDFFLYPAQFWPHKNHILILHALKLLKEENITPKFVFTGSDKGNRDFIERRIKEFGLGNQIVMCGFIKTEELLWLYRNTRMMVFPCLFGPDNLPPLEALACDAQVAVADIPGARDYLPGQAVRFFDPTNERQLAELLRESLNDEMVRQQSPQLPATGEYVNNLLSVFEELALLRRCWD